MSLRLPIALAFALAASAASSQPMHHSAAMNAAQRQAAIREALTAAPPAVAAHARVVDMEGHVLREGNNGFTCMPSPVGTPAGRHAPMCLDDIWLAAMQAYAHHDNGFRPHRVGIAYMLAGDTGTSNINPYDEHRTRDNQWVEEGPHLMMIEPDPARLEGVSTDPHNGGPYVMWPNTPYAHIMIPVGPRTGTAAHR
jgi:hypothetical protein